MDDVIAALRGALDGRYRIERELGQGGMAMVYLAADLKHERPVALKVLRPELAAVLGAERFLGEIRTTANLQHPNILPLFDSGDAGGFLFYVMPYVEGETLRDRLERERQLGVEEAVRLTRSIAAALQTAHEQGVIHRDVKPENVLLSRGEPLVSDFGIALAVSAAGGGRLTETGLSLGTPYYMSPEQASADRDPGPASDVYSLGCVLYEMLVGDPPHTGKSAQAVLAKILTEEPRSLTQVRRTVPVHVADAVARALERLPADRFESADAFARALADPGFRHAAGTAARDAAAEPTEAAAAGPGRSAAALPWALTALLAVALAGALLTRPTVPDPLPTTRALLDLGSHTLGGAPGELRISPDGSTIAIVARRGDDSFLAIRRADEADFRPVPGTEGAIAPAFSPDGLWLAYTDSDARTLMRVSVRGGAPQVVHRGGFPVALDWGPDDWIVFVDDDGGGLWRVRGTGGAPEELVDGRPLAGVFLPGGSAVALSWMGGGVHLLDLDTRTETELVPQATHPRYVEPGYLLWVDGAGALWAGLFDARTGTLGPERGIVLDGVRHFGLDWAVYDVSRNGTLVYATGGSVTGGERRLVTVRLDGAVEVEPLEPRTIRRPRWSPDGRYVAYSGLEAGEQATSAQQIYTYDMVVKSRPRRLTSEGANTAPVWSPDGTRIAFASERAGTDGVDVFVKDVTSDEPETRLWSAPGPQHPASWPTRDVLIIGNGDREEPWLLELPEAATKDSVRGRPFFESETGHEEMFVAPQGDLAVYSAYVDGAWDVFVRSYPEAGSPEKISEGGGDYPVWSPDGQVVYYWDIDADSLWIARIDRGPPFAVVERAPVLDWDPYSIPIALHPDGDRFVTTLRADAVQSDSPPERTFIVTNWFAELRARMRGGGG